MYKQTPTFTTAKSRGGDDWGLVLLNSWWMSHSLSIGGFHAISGDTNDNGEMNKCWWTNKTS